MLSLDKIQQQFADILLHPEDEAGAAALFHPHPCQQDRLALYRGNLTAIWTSALQNAYPVLHQLVGEEYFEQLARAFGRAYPSGSGDLNQFGAQLPDFLKTVPDVADYPYFPDVASLEWQIHRAYYAADAEILNLAGLVRTVAEHGLDLQVVQLEMRPATSFFCSEWDAVAIWLAHQPNTQNSYAGDIRQASFCAISRPYWSVELTSLSRPEYLALTALQQGATLAEAMENAVDEDAQFDVQAHLQKWLAAGLFKCVKFSDLKV